MPRYHLIRFFSFPFALSRMPSPSPSNNEALRFIENPDLNVAALSNHNRLSKLFVHNYYTALLSSAHMVSVFSVAADVFLRKLEKITELSFQK